MSGVTSNLIENRIYFDQDRRTVHAEAYFNYSDENRTFYGFRPMNERVFPQPTRLTFLCVPLPGRRMNDSWRALTDSSRAVRNSAAVSPNRTTCA